MSKEPLLFLCHRIPFPPNKGDKIRSFNIVKKLAEHYDIHLGCFIDDPFDKQYVSALDQYCASVFTLDQHKTLAKIKGLTSFLTAKPITLPYYFDRAMQKWVDKVLSQHQVSKIFVYSSSMAQYIENSTLSEQVASKLERVIDFVDVDSDKWRQYAEKKSGIAKWVFNREYQQLAKYEDKICAEFDHSLFVSPDEAQLFRQRQPSNTQLKVHGMLNGVDIEFFNPQAVMADEKLPSEPFIAFTGAMDYWANVDSVIWFAEQVWPLVRQQHSNAKFLIVGGNPSAEVQALSAIDGIIITGRVHDIRPYIAKAECVVAPMRIARGIQNKVLEAMSLNKATVCTSMAMEGINAPQSSGVKITDDANEFANYCSQYLSSTTEDISNRQWIIEHFTWQQTLAPLMQYFTEQGNH